MTTSESDYNTSNFNGLVDIGDYKLHIQLAGPQRTDDDPLIILIHGTAGHLEQYAAVIRALEPTHRLLAYTRRGLGKSDPYPSTADATPEPPSLDSIAAELTALLTTTALPPPYILVGHSWGGMISTHLASTCSTTPLRNVQGLVLLDSGMPTLPYPLPPTTNTTSNPKHQLTPLYTSFATDPGTPWAHPAVQSLLTGLDTFTLQDPSSALALTPTEYTALVAARNTPQHAAGAQREFQGLFASYLPFTTHYPAYLPPSSALPHLPICLVHAHAHESFQRMYAAGVARGNGTDAERREVERLLSTWAEDVRANQRQFLRFVRGMDGEEGMGRAIVARGGTSHAVHMQDVESVVEGVRWVVERRGPRGMVEVVG